eukprot:404047-Prymnesium_polylepis.3
MGMCAGYALNPPLRLFSFLSLCVTEVPVREYAKGDSGCESLESARSRDSLGVNQERSRPAPHQNAYAALRTCGSRCGLSARHSRGPGHSASCSPRLRRLANRRAGRRIDAARQSRMRGCRQARLRRSRACRQARRAWRGGAPGALAARATCARPPGEI